MHMQLTGLARLASRHTKMPQSQRKNTAAREGVRPFTEDIVVNLERHALAHCSLKRTHVSVRAWLVHS